MLVEPAVAPAIPPTTSDVTPTSTPPTPMEEQAVPDTRPPLMEEQAAAVVPVNQLIQTIQIIPQFVSSTLRLGCHFV